MPEHFKRWLEWRESNQNELPLVKCQWPWFCPRANWSGFCFGVAGNGRNHELFHHRACSLPPKGSAPVFGKLFKHSRNSLRVNPCCARWEQPAKKFGQKCIYRKKSGSWTISTHPEGAAKIAPSLRAWDSAPETAAIVRAIGRWNGLRSGFMGERLYGAHQIQEGHKANEENQWYRSTKEYANPRALTVPSASHPDKSRYVGGKL